MSTAAFTVNEKLVVLVTPLVPVTVIVNVPAGVVVAVFIVMVVVQVGLHDVGEKLADAPVCNPDIEYETDCAVPDVSVEVIVFVVDEP